MAKETQWVKVSGYLFLLGVLIAIVNPFMNFGFATTLLVVIGALVGLLGALGMGSVSKNESEMFLLATVALIAAGGSGAALASIPSIGGYLQNAVNGIAALVAPAAVILALAAIWKAGAVKFG